MMASSTGLRRHGSTYSSSQIRGLPTPANALGTGGSTSLAPLPLVRRMSPRVHRPSGEHRGPAHGYSNAPAPERPFVSSSRSQSQSGGVSKPFTAFRMSSAPDAQATHRPSLPATPPATKFHAVVQNLASERIEVSMDVTSHKTTVLHLKLHISTVWRVPPVFQQLVSDMVVLSDGDMLVNMIRDDGTPCTVTMALVIEEIFRALYDQDNCMRCKAVEQVGLLAKQGDVGAVGELIERTKDFDGEVRREAVVALIALVEQGMDRAMQTVLKSVHDSYIGVRVAVLTALAKRARRGGYDHIQALVAACLEDGDIIVRALALELLLSTASTHYDKIVLVLGERSAMHHSQEVRHAAEDALEMVAKHMGEKGRRLRNSVEASLSPSAWSHPSNVGRASE